MKKNNNHKINKYPDGGPRLGAQLLAGCLHILVAWFHRLVFIGNWMFSVFFTIAARAPLSPDVRAKQINTNFKNF